MIDINALKPSDEDRMIEDAYRYMLDGYLAGPHRKKVEIIERAYRFAREAHKGVRRRSGEPYILHPIAVATIVCREMGLGSTSICAALLHDVVEDTEYTVEDIERHFGAKIAGLVEGLTKISGGKFGDKASVQAENFRKLLLTMSEDIRVVLVKMADRLHNMRTLGSMPPSKQYKIAGETQYIYAPLAHRLGLFAIKTELEDLSFKYEHPAAYDEITRKIAETESHRTQLFTDFSAPIRAKLDAMGLKYEAKARVKSVYSIWKKMQKKGIPFEEVYDLYAMRIVFDCDDPAAEKQMCWSIYSAITDIYKLHPERTRDWVSVPKANGYQALHLTVMGLDGNWVEIQIRSRHMDEVAEKGFAAHWKYKVGDGDEESELTVWLKTIKDILEDPEPSAIDFLDTLKLNLFSSEIVVFTPKGELLTLPAGATVLDVAFTLHTDIGSHCIAGKANHKLVPLGHVLSSGDQVEVLTSQQQTPQPEWVNYVTTAKGKTRLRRALLKMRQPIVAKGRQALDATLADAGIPFSNQVATKLMGLFHVANLDELCYQLGSEEIELNDYVLKTLKKVSEKSAKPSKSLIKKILTLGGIASKIGKEQKSLPPATTPEPAPVDLKATYTLGTGSDGTPNYVLADCCHPIAGDDVLGFVGDDGRVEVHALTCPRAMLLKASYGPRIVDTRWGQDAAAAFTAHIHIEGIDRHGILQELTQLISMHLGMDIRRLNIGADQEVFNAELWVRVQDTSVIDSLCAKLMKVPGVKAAARVTDIDIDSI